MEVLSTKEKIIQAAFSFYKDYHFERISLSQIAAKVGISKAAIFKHFKNKDDLLACMEEKVFAGIMCMLEQVQKKIDSGDDKDLLFYITVYLCQHIEYINFFNSVNATFTFDEFILKFREQGIAMFNSLFSDTGSPTNVDSYRMMLYIAVMLLEFIHRFSLSATASEKAGIESYARKTGGIISRGLCLNEERLTEERIGQLDTICIEAVENVPPVDETFKALAKIVEKSGYEGVTMEALAGELGMAKSSFYSTYKSKEEMIFSLLRKEHAKILDFFLCVLEKAESFSEKIYVMYSSCMNYFYRHSEILEACKYLRFSSFMNKQHMEDFSCNDVIGRIWSIIFLQGDCPSEFPDFMKEIVFESFFLEPVYILLHFLKHGFSEKDIRESPAKIYEMLCFGTN